MINKVILIGNVGMDPEVRTLEGGVKMVRLRLATTEKIYNRQTQESKEHTEWHTIIAWRSTADFVDRFVKKGSQLYIEGRLRSREWEDQTGAKRYAVEIVADDLKLLGRRPEQGTQQGQWQAPAATPAPAYAAAAAMPSAQQPETPVEDPDDLPF